MIRVITILKATRTGNLVCNNMDKMVSIAVLTKSKYRVLFIFTITILVGVLVNNLRYRSPKKITYPVDILLDTPAPVYQSEFELQDAIFSSKFESGNLKSAM